MKVLNIAIIPTYSFYNSTTFKIVHYTFRSIIDSKTVLTFHNIRSLRNNVILDDCFFHVNSELKVLNYPGALQQICKDGEIIADMFITHVL